MQSSDRHGTTSRPGRTIRSATSTDDRFAEIFGFSSPFGQPSYTGGQGSANPPRPHKAAPIENRLLCNLEDLYKGATKKIKISREILDSNGRTMSVDEIVTINIKPGWKKGTKITFPEKGNEAPGVIAADIVFIVDEKPHEVFTREGNDLIMTQKISLAEALTGYNAQVTTLDGRHLSISINSDEVVVPKEGMPIPKEPSKKGNLRIKCNIKFPSRLTAQQRAGMKKLLGS
ncbi:protein psi1-like [Carex rostrata]